MKTKAILSRVWQCKKTGIILKLSLIAVALFLLSVSYASWRIKNCSGRVYSDLGNIPPRDYGLLFGTAKIVQGKYLNQYYTARIEAAAELYHAGKIKKIIVSGDNRFEHYNEPEDMKNDLIAAGVKTADILPDYAGRRTLDSVIRAKNLYGADSYTVISQKFHCERAIFIAENNGIDAIGYEAKEVSARYRFKRFFREPISCLLAYIDVKILHSKPYFEK